MSTGNTYVEFTANRLIEVSDLKDRFFDYLSDDNIATRARVYDDSGVFSPALALTGPAADKFSITGSSLATDGLGHLLDVNSAYSYCQNVSFENTLNDEYEVGLHFESGPMIDSVENTIRLNPNSAQPEYIGRMEFIGTKGEPDAVNVVSDDITFTIDTLCEAGVSHAGRKALVYLKVPQATTSTIGLRIETVAYSGGSNKVTVLTDKLGQSTASSDTADYEIILLGPTVRLNSSLVNVSGCTMIGSVTGAGIGVAPTVFTTGGLQQLITVSLSDLNNAFETFAQPKTLAAAEAGSKAEITEQSWGAANVVDGDSILVIGGITDVAESTVTNKIYAYDTDLDSWSTKAATVPDNFNALMSAVKIGDIVYIAGGHDTAAGTDKLRRYNAATDSFLADLAAMPATRYGGALVAVNTNDLYYIGGDTGAPGAASPQLTVYKYDIGLDSWSTVTGMATTKARVNAVYSNGEIYVLGGSTDDDHYSGTDDTCYKYNVAGDSWSVLATMPTTETHDPFDSTLDNAPSTLPAIGIHNGLIHLMVGGGNQFGCFSSHHVYSVDTDEWTVMPRPQVPYMLGTSFGLVDGIMYMFGGLVKLTLASLEVSSLGGFACNISQIYAAQSAGSAVDVGTYPRNSGTAVETSLLALRQARVDHSVCPLGNGFLITGGQDGTQTTFYSDAEMYWPQTQTSCEVRQMSVNRAMHGSFSKKFGEGKGSERAIILAGWSATSTLDRSTLQYNPHNNTWTTITALGVDRRSYSVAVVGDVAYIVGGIKGVSLSTHMDAYDIASNQLITSVAVNEQMINPDVAVRGTTIYQAGGVGTDLRAIDVARLDNTTANTFDTIDDQPALPGSFDFGGMAKWNNRLYIYDPDGARLLEWDLDAGDVSIVATGLSQRWGANMKIQHGRCYLFGGATSGAMNTSTTTVYEVTIPNAPVNEAPELPTNFATKKRGDSVGFKLGQPFGVLSWDAQTEADFVRMSAEVS